MKLSIQKRLFVGAAAALIVLSVVAVLTDFNTTRLIVDSRWVAHTMEVLEALEAVRATIVDVESSQRGYLITEDPRFLIPYDAALPRLGPRLKTLERLTANSPDQRRQVARLQELIPARLEMMHQGIELVKAHDAAAARRWVSTGPGESRTSAIRLVIDQMALAERDLLDRRVIESESSARAARTTVFALIVLTLFLFASTCNLVQRDIARRARSAETLRRSQERFELAVRGSRDGLWDWDITTDDVYFSPRWKAQLGYEDHEVRNRFEEWESRLHPDDRDRAMQTVATYLEGGQPEYDLEHRLRHKDGAYRWIRARGVALRMADGTAYRMAGSHTDITARKEAERQLAEQNRQLEEAARSERAALEVLKDAQARLVQTEKLAGLGQMVAGVAHEINNPLSFVTNNVAVLARDLGDLRDLLFLYEDVGDLIARDRPERAREIAAVRERADIDYLLPNLAGLLDRTREGLRRIQHIVTDLRAFARLDEGEVNEADLNSGVESTVTIIRGHARKKQVRLELDLGPLPPITCHAAKINQVVMNLVANAIDACKSDDAVTIRTRAEGAGARIEVADTGTGIAPAVRDRIFDPFFTTKPVGQGTGLGLSISYAIIRDHGGTIEVASEPGRGTTFTVHLPGRPPRPRKPGRDGPAEVPATVPA